MSTRIHIYLGSLGHYIVATLPVSRSGHTVTNVREFIDLCYQVIAVRPFARVLTFLGQALLTCVKLVSGPVYRNRQWWHLSAITIRCIVRQCVGLQHNTSLPGSAGRTACHLSHRFTSSAGRTVKQASLHEYFGTVADILLLPQTPSDRYSNPLI